MFKTEVNATVYICVYACVNTKIIIQISMLMLSGKSFSISEPFSLSSKIRGLNHLIYKVSFNYKFQPFLSNWQIVLTLLQ